MPTKGVSQQVNLGGCIICGHYHSKQLPFVEPSEKPVMPLKKYVKFSHFWLWMKRRREEREKHSGESIWTDASFTQFQLVLQASGRLESRSRYVIFPILCCILFVKESKVFCANSI